jgi:hypothetical protein
MTKEKKQTSRSKILFLWEYFDRWRKEKKQTSRSKIPKKVNEGNTTAVNNSVRPLSQSIQEEIVKRVNDG